MHAKMLYYLNADYIVYPSRSNVTFNRGTLTLECYSGEPVTIEIVENATGNLKVIETRIDTQPPPFQTLHDAGFVHYAKTTFGTEDSHAKGQIVCKNSSSEVPLFVWNFDNEYICKCNWSELQQSKKQFVTKTYPPILYPCKTKKSQKNKTNLKFNLYSLLSRTIWTGRARIWGRPNR
jgi:hypothetical protein